MKPLTPDQAYTRLARMCSRTEYAPAQCLAKMLAWGVPAQQAREVVQRLVDERFVDEERFARAFTNDSVRFSHHGRIKIAYGLRQKGVSAEVIAEAIAQIDDEEYARVLESLLEARARTLNAASRVDAMNKLLRYAAQRGFEQSLVYPVAQRLAAEWNDTSCDDEY